MYTQIAEVDRRADTRAIRQSWRRNSQDFSSIVPSGECRGCNQCELDVFADGNYDMLLSIVCDIYPLMKMSESLRRQPGKRRSRERDVSNWLFSINDSQILDSPACCPAILDITTECSPSVLCFQSPCQAFDTQHESNTWASREAVVYLIVSRLDSHPRHQTPEAPDRRNIQ